MFFFNLDSWKLTNVLKSKEISGAAQPWARGSQLPWVRCFVCSWVPGWQDLGTSWGHQLGEGSVTMCPARRLLAQHGPFETLPGFGPQLVKNWLGPRRGQNKLSVARKPQDEVSLLNQRRGRDGRGLLVLSGTGTVFMHVRKWYLFTANVWEIRQADRYLPPLPVWEESKFGQTSLHSLLAVGARQMCQLFGWFHRNIILGFYLSMAGPYSPPLSEQFFSRDIGLSAIHYSKWGACTRHGGSNMLSWGMGNHTVVRGRWGMDGHTPLSNLWLLLSPLVHLSIPPCISPSPCSWPLRCPVPPRPHRAGPALDAGGCWVVPTLHEVRWEQQKLGQGLADGQAVSGLTGSWAGRGRGTARCAQGVLEQPGSTTTFKFFHFQSFPLH